MARYFGVKKVLKQMYPATYNFKDDDVGDDPSGWTIADGLDTEISVIASLDGHRKVLKFYDNEAAAICEATTPTWTVVADNNLCLLYTSPSPRDRS